MNPLEFLPKYLEDNKLEEQEWRQHLGRFGVHGKMQTTKIGALSDGIHSRLIFSIIAFKKPNVLVLDEPTNHLDMDCIDSLASAIHDFAGGVILVSHDFRLIDQVAKTIWVCDDDKVATWKGDIRSYKEHIASKLTK